MSGQTQRGFAVPNFTAVPNEFFDRMLAEISTEAELKVTLAIFRATFGFHQRERVLSLRELARRTGLARSSVQEGVERALRRGSIERVRAGAGFSYTINVWLDQCSARGGVPESGKAGVPESGHRRKKELQRKSTSANGCTTTDRRTLDDKLVGDG